MCTKTNSKTNQKTLITANLEKIYNKSNVDLGLVTTNEMI